MERRSCRSTHTSQRVIAREPGAPAPRPIGVGIGLRRPRPPNRTGGFPAYGSPVDGFCIETASLLVRPCEARPTRHSRRGIMPPMTPLPAPTARVPSMPWLRPTLHGVWPSASCLASSALTMLFCLDMLFARPPSCPAFPRTGFATPSSRGPCTRPQRYYAGSDSSPARTRR